MLFHQILESRETDAFLQTSFFFVYYIIIIYEQKESGTGMATVSLLPTVSAWLRVDQLQMPEEQVSW